MPHVGYWHCGLHRALGLYVNHNANNTCGMCDCCSNTIATVQVYKVGGNIRAQYYIILQFKSIMLELIFVCTLATVEVHNVGVNIRVHSGYS